MSDDKYKVVFAGQIMEGAELDVVKAKVGTLFKADEATLAKLFSGTRVTVRKDLDLALAQKYAAAFEKAGAICDLLPMNAAAPAPAAPAPAAAPVSAGMAVDDSAPPAAPVDRSVKTRRGPGKGAIIGAVVVLVLVLLVAATPFVAGMMAEQQFRAVMSHVQELSGQQASVYTIDNRIDYRRGWLGSTAINTITLDTPEGDPVTFELHSDISHGPILLQGNQMFGLAAVDTRLPLSAEQQAKVAELWRGVPDPIRIRSHIGFDGSSLTRASVAAFQVDENIGNDGENLSFGELSGTIKFSEQFSRADANFDWNGVKLETPDTSIEVGKFTMSSNKTLAAGNLWVGDDNLTLSSITFGMPAGMASPMGPAPSNGRLEGFKINAHSEVDSANMLSGHTTLSVTSISAENQVLASNVRMTLAVERLPAGPLQSITEKLSAQQNSALQGGAPMMDMSQFQDDLGQILAAGPVVKITELRATTEQGDINANLEASINNADPSMLQNPMFLMLALEASGHASVPMALVQTTPLALYLPGFLQQGFITEENGQVKTEVRFRQGQLTLNGIPLQ